jgi:hypothetical protein
MSMTLAFVIITVIIVFIMFYNQIIDRNRFVQEITPYFHFLMEDDYKFLLEVRYPNDDVTDEAVEQMFGGRVRRALAVIVILIIFFMNQMNFVNIMLSVIIGYLVFKLPYMQLSNYYKKNLHYIDMMLPYYLKSLEILIQHYTVPVALSKSIDTAPEIFKSGLKKMVQRIDAGDSSVDPYMAFAQEYPVRDSMRMMRLLYRLGLGAQDTKQEQLMMFSRTVSSLQNKSREEKYKQRLETMEGKTLMMLGVTGGGILLLMLYAMMSMMSV